MIGNTAETVLQLIRKAVDNSFQMALSDAIDWTGAMALASSQAVSALCLESIELLPAKTLPKQLLLQWIGLAERQRNQYEQAWRVACKLDKLWAVEGIQATVLKGRSIAKYYPVPSHRYSCDLDLFIGVSGDEPASCWKGKEYGWNTRCIKRWSSRWTMSMWSATGI